MTDQIKKLIAEIESYRSALTWCDSEGGKKWLRDSIASCQKEIERIRDEESQTDE